MHPMVFSIFAVLIIATVAVKKILSQIASISARVRIIEPGKLADFRSSLEKYKPLRRFKECCPINLMSFWRFQCSKDTRMPEYIIVFIKCCDEIHYNEITETGT